MSHLWTWFDQASSHILLAVAVIGAIYTLITHWSKYRLWSKRRIERKNMLDSLIDNGHHLICSQQLQVEHNQMFEDIHKSINDLSDKVIATNSVCEITKGHNLRQDAEIEQIASNIDIVAFGVYALIDDAVVNQGKNGNLRAAFNHFNEKMMAASLDLKRDTHKGVNSK